MEGGTVDDAFQGHPARSMPDPSSYDERHHPDFPWDWAPDHPVNYDRRRSVGDTMHPLDHPDHARYHPDEPIPYASLRRPRVGDACAPCAAAGLPCPCGGAVAPGFGGAYGAFGVPAGAYGAGFD